MDSFFRNISENYSYWIIIVVVIVCAAVIGFSFSKKEGMEKTAEIAEESQQPQEPQEEEIVLADVKQPMAEEGDEEYSQSLPQIGDNASITPEDLLPKSDDVKNFEKNFKNNKLNRNFLTSGHHIGINTVSSSLKNANLSLRSDPVIPRVSVGPWNEATILPSDIMNRRKFEIGSGS